MLLVGTDRHQLHGRLSVGGQRRGSTGGGQRRRVHDRRIVTVDCARPAAALNLGAEFDVLHEVYLLYLLQPVFGLAFLQVITDAGFEFGCFVIPSTDFTHTGVLSAALKTTVTDTTQTCPGPTGGLSLPITLDVAWSGTGPISTLNTRSHFACLAYSTKTHNITTSNNANATGTVTTPQSSNAFTSVQSSLVSGDVHIHAQGVDQPACINRG